MEKQASKPITAPTLYKRRKKINLRPDYQRGLVWKKVDKQLLIDTILQDFYVPELLLRIIDRPGFDYDVLDGQQRIATLFQFMEDGFRIAKNTIFVIDGKEIDVSNLYYSQLPEEIKNMFDSFSFSFVAIKGDDDEIEEMFRRLQAGQKLLDVEKRNSISGLIRDYVREMVEHPFLTTTCGCNEKTNNHMQFNKLIEQLLILEIYQTNEMLDIQTRSLQRLYNDYNKNGLPDEIAKKFTSILDFLFNAFKDNYEKNIFSKTAVQGLYMLLSTELEKNEKEMNKNADKFAEWFINFENVRDNVRKVTKEDPESEIFKDERNRRLKKYNDAMIGGTNSKESLQIRKDILLEDWKVWNNQLVVA